MDKKTLKSLFSEALFRIPDYQRGYAWEKKQLNDFIQDIDALVVDEVRNHYTGTIVVFCDKDAEENIYGIIGEVPAETLARHQSTDSLRMLFPTDLTERFELRLELTQKLLTVFPLPLRLFRVEAQDVTPPALSVADHRLLHSEVSCHLTESARTRHDLLGDCPTTVHGHPHDVPATCSAEPPQVLPRDHPGVSHEDAPAQMPTLQIFLHPLDRGDVHSVPRKHPVAHWKAIPGDGHPDHDLRGVPTTVLGVPPAPQPGPVLIVDLEVQGRRVVEEKIDLEVEEVSHTEEDLLLDLLLVSLEEVHRSVQVVKLDISGAFDPHLVLVPMSHTVHIR